MKMCQESASFGLRTTLLRYYDQYKLSIHLSQNQLKEIQKKKDKNRRKFMKEQSLAQNQFEAIYEM